MSKSVSWWNQPFAWTEEEAAARLRITEDELRALVDSGRLTAARVGPHLRFTDRDLAALLEKSGSLGRKAHARPAAFMAAAAVALVTAAAWAIPWSQALPGAVPLSSHMIFSSAPTQTPPLDTGVGFYRKLTAAEGAGSGTAENLSLYMENTTGSATRYPWPFYVELNTNHQGGDGVSMYARLRNAGPGWATGVHSEAIITGTSSTNIGFNAEMSPMVGGTRTIGVNLQAKDGYGGVTANQWSHQAVNIQSDTNVGWDTGIKFDTVRTNTAVHFSPQSSGQRAIWVQGNYTVGVDVGNLPIRMNAGTPVQLEATAQITMSFNQSLQRIEFKNGTRLLGYVSAQADASGGKMN